MPDPIGITRACSGLVTTVKTEDKSWASLSRNPDIEVLQLAHFSVQHYLTSDQVQLQWRNYLSEAYAVASNARLCLAYCSHLQQDVDISQTTHDFPFAEYSANYWPRYAPQAEQHDEDLSTAIQDLFSRNKKAFVKWYHLYNETYPSNPIAYKSGGLQLDPIFFAASWGLSHCVELLLCNGVDVNARYYDYAKTHNALSLAIRKKSTRPIGGNLLHSR